MRASRLLETPLGHQRFHRRAVHRARSRRAADAARSARRRRGVRGVDAPLPESRRVADDSPGRQTRPGRRPGSRYFPAHLPLAETLHPRLEVFDLAVHDRPQRGVELTPVVVAAAGSESRRPRIGRVCRQPARSRGAGGQRLDADAATRQSRAPPAWCKSPSPRSTNGNAWPCCSTNSNTSATKKSPK